MKSMTGFGQARVERDSRYVDVELSTVNNRHLEVKFSYPGDRELEKQVVETIKSRLERGTVEVQVTSNVLDQERETVQVNERLLDRYTELFERIYEDSPNLREATVSDLLQLPGVLELASEVHMETGARDLLMDALNEALDGLVTMREREGDALREDLAQRESRIRERIEAVQERFPEALEKYRSNLRERLEEALDFESERLQDEVENQVKKYAEKCDINEEIVRVLSHLDQFRDYLNTDEPVGKELKFLVQEMQREINTIGAKANDSFISHQAVDVKSELEKCREQIKNVE